MTFFATEFPVKPIQHPSVFVAQVISWLRGTQYSTVLDNATDRDLEGDNAHLRSPRGEELRLREFRREGKFEGIGFRHDVPDGEGRIWRTDVVLRRDASVVVCDLIRLRTQCTALSPGVRLDVPRKPYFLKGLLQDGWGAKDGDLTVSDAPIWLADDENGLQIACAITLGNATRHLPVIYVSAAATDRWLITREQIERLAFDLGGVAHLVVEPNRAFSFRLREYSESRNAYGGNIAIALPQKGIVHQYFLGWRFSDPNELARTLRSNAIRLRNHMPAIGWDWTELQEEALRQQRQKDRARLTSAETEELYKEEIENLGDRIQQLEEQLAEKSTPNVIAEDEDSFYPNLLGIVGPEIYQGEFLDRLRLAARECVTQADQIGLDNRTRYVLETLSIRLPISPAFRELKLDIERATKNGPRTPRR